MSVATKPQARHETIAQEPAAKQQALAVQAPKELRAPPRVNPIIPQTYAEVQELAKAIADAGWAPKTYLVDPKNWNSGFSVQKIAVAILHGMEVGFTPIAALQSIAVINGTPTIWGDGALALVQASGLCVDFDEHQIVEDGKFRGYEVIAKRRDRQTPIHHRFTLDMATKAGLLNKEGPWKAYPTRMCQMRARAWVLRDGFADVLRGLAIREEIEDYIQAQDGSWSPPTTGEPPIMVATADEGGGDGSAPVPQEQASSKTQEDNSFAVGIELMTADGDVIEFERPSAFADRLIQEMKACGQNRDSLTGLWESNEASLKTIQNLAADQYERIVATYNALTAEPTGEKYTTRPKPSPLLIAIPTTPQGVPNLMAYAKLYREKIASIGSTAELEAFGEANHEVLSGLPATTKAALTRTQVEKSTALKAEGR